MNSTTRKLTTVGMLCALAYVMTAVGRIPLVLFLKYDPKDVVIALGGLIFGPFTAFSAALIVSFAEMLTISENGLLGLLMNVISSCSFACTAAFIYKKRRQISDAVVGLLCGWGCMAAVMLFWNYLITPIYMGYPREAVAELLLPVFLPFNLIKGGLNAAITLLAYRPVITALRRSHLPEAGPSAEPTRAGRCIAVVLYLTIAAVLLLLSFRSAS